MASLVIEDGHYQTGRKGGGTYLNESMAAVQLTDKDPVKASDAVGRCEAQLGQRLRQAASIEGAGHAALVTTSPFPPAPPTHLTLATAPPLSFLSHFSHRIELHQARHTSLGGCLT